MCVHTHDHRTHTCVPGRDCVCWCTCGCDQCAGERRDYVSLYVCLCVLQCLSRMPGFCVSVCFLDACVLCVCAPLCKSQTPGFCVRVCVCVCILDNLVPLVIVFMCVPAAWLLHVCECPRLLAFVVSVLDMCVCTRTHTCSYQMPRFCICVCTRCLGSACVLDA